jgi:hypothetical protein
LIVPRDPTPSRTWVPEARRVKPADRKAGKGASPAPGALHPLIGEGKRDTGGPALAQIRAAERWLSAGCLKTESEKAATRRRDESHGASHTRCHAPRKRDIQSFLSECWIARFRGR